MNDKGERGIIIAVILGGLTSFIVNIYLDKGLTSSNLASFLIILSFVIGFLIGDRN